MIQTPFNDNFIFHFDARKTANQWMAKNKFRWDHVTSITAKYLEDRVVYEISLNYFKASLSVSDCGKLLDEIKRVD